MFIQCYLSIFIEKVYRLHKEIISSYYYFESVEVSELWRRPINAYHYFEVKIKFLWRSVKFKVKYCTFLFFNLNMIIFHWRWWRLTSGCYHLEILIEWSFHNVKVKDSFCGVSFWSTMQNINCRIVQYSVSNVQLDRMSVSQFVVQTSKSWSIYIFGCTLSNSKGRSS